MEDFLKNKEYQQSLDYYFKPWIYESLKKQAFGDSSTGLNLSEEIRSFIESASIEPYYNKEFSNYLSEIKPHSDKINNQVKQINLLLKKKNCIELNKDFLIPFSKLFQISKEFNKSRQSKNKNNPMADYRKWKAKKKKQNEKKIQLSMRINYELRNKMKDLSFKTGLKYSDIITCHLLNISLSERPYNDSIDKLEIIGSTRSNTVQAIERIHTNKIKILNINEEKAIAFFEAGFNLLGEIKEKE